MSDHARAYWRLLDDVEDLITVGERTGHADPGQVVLRESAAVKSGSASGARMRAASADSVPVDELHPSHDWDAEDETAVRARRLALLEERVRACTRCPLHEGRMNAVPGQGVLDPLVMVIGEGPGADEDRRGVPFVGRAGQFLDRWLAAVDLDRTRNVYIGNIVKCRPPKNRDPRPNESDACLPYLRDQIDLIRPKAILTVGRIASGILIGTSSGITSLRGRTFYYEGTPLIPTFHPSAVLRNPDLKRPVWEDLKRLRALLDALPADG